MTAGPPAGASLRLAELIVGLSLVADTSAPASRPATRRAPA